MHPRNTDHKTASVVGWGGGGVERGGGQGQMVGGGREGEYKKGGGEIEEK